MRRLLRYVALAFYLAGRLRRVLRNARFRSPIQSKLAIFDREGSQYLLGYCLPDVKACVLPVRGEEYLLGARVLWYMLLEVRIFFLRTRFYRDIASRSFHVYLTACIRASGARVVVTHIDNNHHFRWIAEFSGAATFCAVQNGTRLPVEERWNTGEPILPLPEFFCYSQFDIDIFRRYEVPVKQFHPVGSLIAGYYRKRVPWSGSSREFDVCFISDWYPGVHRDFEIPELKRAILVLHYFLRRWTRNSKARVCVATRSPNPGEKEYYKRLLGEATHLADFDPVSRSTYRIMDQSLVAVTSASTAGREAFGWGQRVLFSNFSGLAQYDPPTTGPWHINRADYSSFARALDDLLNMSDMDYENQSGPARAYFMPYPDVPAHEFIRNAILTKLE